MTGQHFAVSMVQLDTSGILAELVRLGGPELARVLDNAIRRGGRRIVTRAIKDFQTRGIGRSLFFGPKGRRAARSMIKTRRPTVSEGGTVRGIEIIAAGLAALQEVGGSTLPHPIVARSVPVLAFKGGGFAPKVDHQGGAMPAYPAVGNAVAAEESAIREEIENLVRQYFVGL